MFDCSLQPNVLHIKCLFRLFNNPIKVISAVYAKLLHFLWFNYIDFSKKEKNVKNVIKCYSSKLL